MEQIPTAGINTNNHSNPLIHLQHQSNSTDRDTENAGNAHADTSTGVLVVLLAALAGSTLSAILGLDILDFAAAEVVVTLDDLVVTVARKLLAVKVLGSLNVEAATDVLERGKSSPEIMLDADLQRWMLEKLTP